MKVFKDLIWITISQGFSTFIGIVILPFLTKSYGPELFGVWSQISVTVVIFSTVLGLQLYVAFIRFFTSEKNKERLRRGYGSMLLPIILFSIFFIFAFFLFSDIISLFIFGITQYSKLIP